MKTLKVNEDCLEIKDVIFCSGLNFYKNAHFLHKELEEAFSQLGGMQQVPMSTDTPDQVDGWKEQCANGQIRIEIAALNIVKGLLGRDYTIVKRRDY